MNEKVKGLLKQVEMLDETLAYSLEKEIERLVGVSSKYVQEMEDHIRELEQDLERSQGPQGPPMIIDPDTFNPIPSRPPPRYTLMGENVGIEGNDDEVPFEELTTMERLRRNRRIRMNRIQERGDE